MKKYQHLLKEKELYKVCQEKELFRQCYNWKLGY
jgi:hypothetical protein